MISGNFDERQFDDGQFDKFKFDPVQIWQKVQFCGKNLKPYIFDDKYNLRK